MRVKLDTRALLARFNGDMDRAQKVLDSEIIRDSDPYTPFKTGALARSVTNNTVIGSGEIVWRTPYAQRQYNEYPKKNQAIHPKATMKWFEAAKAVHYDEWVEAVAKAGGGRAE